jgi:hypothetical protein
MPIPTRQPAASATGSQPDWVAVAATILIGVVAIGLLWPQVFPGPDQANAATLPNLSRRATMLEQVTNLIQRDSYCIPLSAYGRTLDHALAPDARVFLSGVLGKENAGRSGYYYFLRNYLFPRDVEISMDHQVVFSEDGIQGVDTTSPEELRTNGFDVLLKMDDGGRISILPLTEKGVPRE